MSSLYFLQAPMNASKSAQLLMVAHNYEERNYRVLIVKPAIDTRDGDYVMSRALETKRKVDLIVQKEDLGSIYKYVMIHQYDVVLVDEAQFLTKEQIDELGDIVDDLDVPVMAYGLRTDAFVQSFEGSRRLFEIADKIQEIKTVCPCCGKKAIINMRVDEDGNPIFTGEQVSIGNSYLPVCRKRYKELKKQYEKEYRS